MEDLRFADLPNLATINEAKGEFDLEKYRETDSLFIVFPKVRVNGSIQQLILYPTKLPKDMPVRGDMFLFSGEIKFSPSTPFTPIVLSEFKYFLNIEKQRNYYLESLLTLSEEHKRLKYQHKYKVNISNDLYNMKYNLIEQINNELEGV